MRLVKERYGAWVLQAKPHIAARMPEATKQSLEGIARLEGKSLSELVRELIFDGLERRARQSRVDPDYERAGTGPGGQRGTHGQRQP